MGKVTKFAIVFDHPQAVYRTGETVRGNVLMTISEPMKLNNVRLFMSGRSDVLWLAYHPLNKLQPIVTTIAQEVYFQKTIDLFGSGNEEDKTLEAGEYSYNFSLVLNTELPSSFEGEKGYVRYFCKAMIMKSNGRIGHASKSAFSVVSKLDLNQEPIETLSPITGVKTIKPDGCCVDGTVKTTLTINKSAFVSGEYILINAKVENSSNTEVEMLRASIKQYVEFFGKSDSIFSSGKTKPYTSKRFIASKKIMVNASKGSCNYQRVKLQVPAVPPSRLQGCEQINIFYKIKFYIKVNHAEEAKLSCDLIIGTIPRRDTEGIHSITLPTPTAPITTQPTESKLPGYEEVATGEDIGRNALWDIAPPSYEESVLGKGHIKDPDDSVGGDLNWAPYYPFYSNITERNNTNNNQLMGNAVTACQPIASNFTTQQPTSVHGNSNMNDNIERNDDSLTRL